MATTKTVRLGQELRIDGPCTIKAIHFGQHRQGSAPATPLVELEIVSSADDSAAPTSAPPNKDA